MPAVRLNPRLRAMWKIARFVDVDPAYGEYTERTTREIPVFELRPEGS